jgi:hemerythrin-like metal-binding protein
MALLRWSKKHSVGVMEMDDQHVALVKILNDLHAAMLKGQAQSVADPLFKKLMEYMQQHFSAEEALMERARFPALSEHRAGHHALTAKVEEYCARFKQGDDSMYPALLRFLRDWFVNHMQQVDKEYSVWMHEHGVR